VTLEFYEISNRGRKLQREAILEAVSGTMYVAVLVARLVGLYSSGKSQQT
jgi:hypothetical protein